MLDIDRVQFQGVYYDYIFVVMLRNGKQTIHVHDIGLLQGHEKIAESMNQHYTSYTWNADHMCYVQSRCYPRTPAWPNLVP